MIESIAQKFARLNSEIQNLKKHTDELTKQVEELKEENKLLTVERDILYDNIVSEETR